MKKAVFVLTPEFVNNGGEWPDGKKHSLHEFYIEKDFNNLNYYFFKRFPTPTTPGKD